MSLMPPWSLSALPGGRRSLCGCRRRCTVSLFHVWCPCIREYVLLLLDLQLVGKLGDDVIYQLVVRQGAQRIDVHVAEYLIVDVAVQLLQKFRGTQLGVHLQEH